MDDWGHGGLAAAPQLIRSLSSPVSTGSVMAQLTIFVTVFTNWWVQGSELCVFCLSCVVHLINTDRHSAQWKAAVCEAELQMTKHKTLVNSLVEGIRNSKNLSELKENLSNKCLLLWLSLLQLVVLFVLFVWFEINYGERKTEQKKKHN